MRWAHEGLCLGCQMAREGCKWAVPLGRRLERTQPLAPIVRPDLQHLLLRAGPSGSWSRPPNHCIDSHWADSTAPWTGQGCVAAAPPATHARGGAFRRPPARERCPHQAPLPSHCPRSKGTAQPTTPATTPSSCSCATEGSGRGATPERDKTRDIRSAVSCVPCRAPPCRVLPSFACSIVSCCRSGLK